MGKTPIQTKRVHGESAGDDGRIPYYGILVGMVCLLLLFSVVQAVQINAHERGMGILGVDSPSVQISSPRGPIAPAAAPRMVGGC